MDYSRTFVYGEGHRTSLFRKLSREDDLYDDLLFSKYLGEEKTVFLPDPYTCHLKSDKQSLEDLIKILERCAIDYVVHNAWLAHIQHDLRKYNAFLYPNKDFIEDRYDRCQIPGYYDDSGIFMDDSWESIAETRNRSTSKQSGFKLLQERGKEIKDLTDKLMKKERQCNENHDKISRLEKQLLIVRKQLNDSESKIITIKIEDRTKINKLERDIEDLKRKLSVAQTHVSEFTNKANLRCNFNAESEYTRENKNNLVKMKLKIDEYERKIKLLEKSNKEKEVQLSAVRNQYNACSRDQQKMKADFSKSVSSRQRDLALRDGTIKDLEDKLKKYKGISSGSNIAHFEHTERSSTEIKCKIKLSDQEMINPGQEKEHHESLTKLRSECQDKSQKISDLERQLNEALQKLTNKTEELRANATLHRNEVSNFNADYTRLETQSKVQQRSISSRELTCIELTEANKSLHKMIEDKEKQVRQQREQHQEALKQMQEREEELVMRIDLQKKEILRLQDDLHRSQNTFSYLEKSMEIKTLEKKISDLERQLNEALQKLNNKEEEFRAKEHSHKNEVSNFNVDYTRLETKTKSQQRTISSHELTCIELTEANKSLHKIIEDKEKQVRQQREQHQEALKQMQEREKELVVRIDLQKKEILRLKDDLHRSKNALSHLEKSMQSKTLEKNTNEVKADTDQRKRIAELTKELQEARTKLHDTETELAETKSRLSKVMGNRLTDNNPNITDLSDRNRPTKLAEKYAELYDNQWTDAFDVLEKSFQKEEYVIETLLHILQDVFAFCLKKAKAQMKNLGQELKFADREDKGDVTVDVRKLLKECRKAVGFTENLPKMYQSYLEQSTNDRTKTALKVRAFTAECLEMCWFMVIQDPPVAFAPLLSNGSSFDTDFYKPYTISGAKVDFVVWPPLLLHEGGSILAKGVAQGCGKKTTS